MGIETWITCCGCDQKLIQLNPGLAHRVSDMRALCVDCQPSFVLSITAHDSHVGHGDPPFKAEAQDNYVSHDPHDPVRDAIDGPAEQHKAGDPPRPSRPQVHELPKKPWKSMAMAEAERICGQGDDE